MKASDLRIGNLFIGYNNQVFAWAIKDFALLDLDIEIDEIIKEPIPLTPEWLEKAGFEDNYPWQKGSFSLDSEDRFIVSDSTGYGIIVSRGVEYVHQMQNLIFALTGEELKFKD